MTFLSFFIARFSLAQFVLVALAVLIFAVLSALRPVSAVVGEDGTLNAGLESVSTLKYLDLTEAVARLRESGFVANDQDDEKQTLAGQAITSGAGGGGEAAGESLPRVFAIIRSNGKYSAYLRQDGQTLIAEVGDQAGPWQVEHISQGEVRFANAESSQVIDIFGAPAAEESEE